MNFTSADLLPDASDDWCGQNNIANRAEPYDKYFFQSSVFAKIENPICNKSHIFAK